MERGLCDIGLGHCVLHYVIAACAAASLLYRRLKRAHWQGMPGRDGERHVNKVKSIGGAAYAKAKDSFLWQHRGTHSSAALSHSGSAWRLRYAYSDVWREPVHALLGRYSYRAVYIWMHRLGEWRLNHIHSINSAEDINANTIMFMHVRKPSFKNSLLSRLQLTCTCVGLTPQLPFCSVTHVPFSLCHV